MTVAGRTIAPPAPVHKEMVSHAGP
jgi:hypothetical protein